MEKRFPATEMRLYTSESNELKNQPTEEPTPYVSIEFEPVRNKTYAEKLKNL